MSATFFPLIASSASCPSIRDRVRGWLADGAEQTHPFLVRGETCRQATDRLGIRQVDDAFPPGRMELEIPWVDRRPPASPFPQWQG
jgi:hypothetical protein